MIGRSSAGKVVISAGDPDRSPDARAGIRSGDRDADSWQKPTGEFQQFWIGADQRCYLSPRHPAPILPLCDCPSQRDRSCLISSSVVGSKGARSRSLRPWGGRGLNSDISARCRAPAPGSHGRSPWGSARHWLFPAKAPPHATRRSWAIRASGLPPHPTPGLRKGRAPGSWARKALRKAPR